MDVKILNVDDREVSRYIRSETLRMAGYQVIEASGGAEAIEACKAQQPALVLLDVNMPDMSGFEVCRRIKTECSGQPVIVVHVSATNVALEDSVRGLEGGADGYLTEPVAPELLLATVQSMLRIYNAERTARESGAALRRLMEANVVGIATLDLKGVKEANEAFLRVVGISRAEFKTGGFDWLKATPPEHVERDLRGIEELRKRGVYTPFEKDFVRPDGTRVSVLTGAAALSPEPLEWICFVVDLSERKRAEEQVRLANQALTRSNEELQHFAYALSHDLQSPLRTVSGMAELLARKYGKDLEPGASELVSMIVSGSRRMKLLISDLLEYASLRERSETGTRPINCDSVLKWALLNLQADIERTGADITADPLPWVLADEALARVFQNLIGNAIKYRSAEPPRIHISSERRGGEQVLSVRDNGIGFEMAHASRIFGLFKRLHSADRYEGTGIGLAVCKRIVERYGGRIWAESQPGQGATFYVALPAEDEAGETPDGAAANLTPG